MKKKILVKMFSVFFALALVNNSVVLAKVKTKDVKQPKEQQPKEQQQKEQPKEQQPKEQQLKEQQLKEQQPKEQQPKEQQKEQQPKEQQKEQQPKQQQPKEQQKEQPKEQQQEKNLSQKEEKQKQKQQDIEIIKEASKKIETLEKDLQKKMFNMFKNFKKEDYEVKNYDLEVFKKGDVYILIYTHKKTGAKVFFNLSIDKEKTKKRADFLIFRVPSKDDKGLVHFTEHCVAVPVVNYFIEKLQIAGGDINALTSLENLMIVSKVGVFGLNENLEKEYVEKLSNELRNPTAFEEGSKIFEIEKKRILNEIKDSKGGTYQLNEWYELGNLRDFDIFGTIPEIEKATLKDLKRYYKKYIHPSNCLLIKNVFELNPKKIKNYLKMWHENYFSYFEKKEIPKTKYEPKNKKKYLFKSWPKDSEQFNFHGKDKKENFKYVATVIFDLEKVNLKQRLSLDLTLEPFKEEIEKFYKDLGYGKVVILNNGVVDCYGNKKDLFTQKALEKNSKEILKFIENKFKSLKEEDFFYFLNYDLKNLNKFAIKNLKAQDLCLPSRPEFHRARYLPDLLLKSFNETGNLIDENYFLINKNNEIENRADVLDKYTKENLDVYGKLAQIGPKYFNVFEQNDKTVKQIFKEETEKYKMIPRVLPVKLKEKKLKNPFIEDFANLLLNKVLTKELNDKLGLIYGDFLFKKAAENNFSGRFKINKDSVKPLEDYIFKNFDEIMKNIEIKKEKLNELKKQYKENFNSFKKEYDEYFKDEQKRIKDFENYIKTGKIDENSILKRENLKIRHCLSFIPYSLVKQLENKLLTFYKDFEDAERFFEEEVSFREKYAKKYSEKINPEFAKDFLENQLKPTLKKIKKAYKLAEKKLKALDSIKFSDVKALIKTAYLVKDKEEIKKVNKNIEKKEIRLEKLNKEVIKNI